MIHFFSLGWTNIVAPLSRECAGLSWVRLQDRRLEHKQWGAAGIVRWVPPRHHLLLLMELQWQSHSHYVQG